MLKSKNQEWDDILTTGQIAKICRVDPRTVRRWIDEKALKAYELPVTGFSRIRIEDFLTFLKEHKLPVPDEFKHLNRHRVLIVDDEQAMLNSTRRILTYPDADLYEIETAMDGFEAGRKISAFKPDLVVLDILMPKLDGFGVCRSIRQDPSTRHIKVLVVSSLMNNEERHRAISQGADDFLSKPFEELEFKARIERLLRGGAVQ